MYRSQLVEDESYDLLADTHSVLNGCKNYACWLLMLEFKRSLMGSVCVRAGSLLTTWHTSNGSQSAGRWRECICLQLVTYIFKTMGLFTYVSTLSLQQSLMIMEVFHIYQTLYCPNLLTYLLHRAESFLRS